MSDGRLWRNRCYNRQMQRRLSSFGVALGAIAIVLSTFVIQGASVASAATGGNTYFPLAPKRILNTVASGGTLGPGTYLNLQVANASGVPSDATAVVVNVTVTGTTAASYLTVYPAGTTRPLASNLNWTADETIANLVTVRVGSNYAISLYNANGDTNVIVDLQGYYAPTSTGGGYYAPLTPTRISDTRPNSGYPNAGETLGAGSTLNIQVAGEGGVPSSGATAAMLNVTVTDASAASYLSVYPAGQAWPGTSTLNWSTDETIANRVLVPLGTNGQITVYNHSGTVDVITDVSGYFTNNSSATGASTFYPVAPTRVLDTRASGGTLGPNETHLDQLGGVSVVPASANAVLFNLTVTNTTAASYLETSPAVTTPTTSDLNWPPNTTIANLDLETLGASGDMAIYNLSGYVDVIVDVSGYFVPVSSPPTAPAPCTGAGLTVTNDPTTGATLNVSTSATCPSGITATYLYWYRPPGQSAWLQAGSATTSSAFSYPSTGWAAGTYGLAVWVSTQAGVFQDVSASSSFTFSGNLLSDPSQNLTGSFANTCYADGYATSACMQAEVSSINSARVWEGLSPLTLPSGFYTMSAPERMFVVANEERIARGLPPINGMTAAANNNAEQGASTNNDPNGLNVSGAINFASVWAEDYGDLGAMFDWMYDDGLNSANVDCTSTNTSGCWGHRNNILINTNTSSYSAPSGYTWVAGGSCVPESSVSYFNSCALEWVLVPTSSVSYTYTWSQAVSSGA